MSDPSLLTHEDAVRSFLEVVGPSLQTLTTTEQIIRRLERFYVTTRIVGADDADWDMFCVQIGCYHKSSLPRPDDYRGRGDEAYEARAVTDDPTRYLTISLSRTVHPCGVLEPNSEFDDDAFEMAVDLHFEPRDDRSVRGWIECSSPDSFQRELNASMGRPPLSDLATRHPDEIMYYVGGAG